MNINDRDHFDVVIIGAGMSGLAAGIRLALYDKKVVILERHNVIGGLNSFYSIGGRKFDVGLHAMTNYAPGVKGAPLTRLFRQLRIQPEQFDLSPQRYSRIHFNGCNLRFSNDLDLIKTDIESLFPNQIDGFNRLCLRVEKDFMESSAERGNFSAKEVLGEYISDPLLRNMLLYPVLGYGSPLENDIWWNLFVTLFKSIYLEGLARPYEGIRVILRTLKDKYKALGGVLKVKCGVKEIEVADNKVTGVLLDNGMRITGRHVLSSAGLNETLELCSNKCEGKREDIGTISFTETLYVLKEEPKVLGMDETTVFFHHDEGLNYKCPEDLVNVSCGVVCSPNNYEYTGERKLSEGMIRITTLGNFGLWDGLSEEAYRERKAYWFEAIGKSALRAFPRVSEEKLKEMTLATDMFTPKTVKKFTGHLGGAIYGVGNKVRSGKTHLDNLYICGTDQGLLGVTGALMSGIAMANRHILANTTSQSNLSSA